MTRYRFYKKKFGLYTYMLYICINKKIMKKIYSVIVVIVLVSLTMSSCKTSGYGCKGRESWGGLMKRINKPY